MSGPRMAELLERTLRDPDAAARDLIALNLPMSVRWTALLLVAVLAVLELVVLAMTTPEGMLPLPIMAIVGRPLLAVPLQAAALTIVAGCIAFGGRLFGGRGGFPDALLLVVWLEFCLVVAQGAQLLIGIALPAAAALIGLAVFLWSIYVAVRFVALLHGFRSHFGVFLGMIGGFAVVVVCLAFLLTILGFAPTI